MTGKQIKVYQPLDGGVTALELEYVLKDAVILYDDVAELCWNFIGEDWNNKISYVEININAPGFSKDFRAWGHGPLNGIVDLAEGKQVKFKVSALPSNTAVTARVTMDKGLFGTVTKRYFENGLEKILNEEQSYADEANLRRDIAKNLVYIIPVCIIFAIICPVVWYKKKKSEFEFSDFDGKYFRELPEDYGPAVAAEVKGNIVESNVITATIANMARKKYVNITQIDGKGKDKDYKLELVNKQEFENDETICDCDKYLIMNMLFDESDTFTIKEFKKRFKTDSQNSQAALKKMTWTKKIQADAKKKGIYKEKVPSIYKRCKLAVFLPVILPITLAAAGFHYSYEDIQIIGVILSILIALSQLFVGSVIYYKMKYTKKGITHKQEWKAFSCFLEDFSKMQDYPIQSLILWEHYLVYAVAFGKAKQVIKQLEIMYPDELAQINTGVYSNYALMRLCNDSDSFSNFNKTFNSAMSTAFTPQSSGSGSGGGFSGGGGFRRRRRRWRRLLN